MCFYAYDNHLISKRSKITLVFVFLLAGPRRGGPAHQEKQTGVLISGLWGELNIWGWFISLLHLLSLSLHLPPLTLDNLGLMDTPALLPLLLTTPPPLFYPNCTKGRMDISLPPLPSWRLFPLHFALTLLCHRGRMDITSIHWSPPCFLPNHHTFH